MHAITSFVFVFLLFFSAISTAKPISVLLDIAESSGSNVAAVLARKLELGGYQVMAIDSLEDQSKEELLRFIDGDLTADNIRVLRQTVDFILSGRTSIQAGRALLAGPIKPQSAKLSLKMQSLTTGQLIYQSQTLATSSFGDDQQATEKAILIAVSKAMRGITDAISNTITIKTIYQYRLLFVDAKDKKLVELAFADIKQLSQIQKVTLKNRRVSEIQAQSKLNLENFIAQISTHKTARYHFELVELRGTSLKFRIVDHQTTVDPS